MNDNLEERMTRLRTLRDSLSAALSGVEGELTRRMEIAEVRKSVKCPGQDDVRL